MHRDLNSVALLGPPIEGRVWRISVALTVMLATLVLALFPLVNSIYDARINRDAARMPDLVESAAPSQTIGWGSVGFGSFGRHSVNALNLRKNPDVPSAAPVGLPRWPGPGEVFASPALLSLPGGAEYAATYGRVVGAINPATLTDPQELLLYVGIDPDLPNGTGLEWPITRFGITPGNTGITDQGYLGSALRQPPRTTLRAVIGLFCLAPALVVTLIVVRLGGDRRDRDIGILKSLGARTGDLTLILIRVVGPWATGGALLGFAVVFLASRGHTTIPVVGYSLAGTDIQPALPQVAGAGLAAVIVTLGLVVATHRPWRKRSRRAKTPRTIRAVRSWPLFGLLACIAAANWLHVALYRTDPEAALVYSLLAAAGAIAFLGPATAPLVSGLGSALRWLSARLSSGSALIASAQLRNFSRATVRVCVIASLVIVVGLQMQVLRSQGSEIARTAAQAMDANADRVLMTDNLTGRDLQWAARFVSGHTGDYGVLLAAESPAKNLSSVWGTCANLKVVFERCPKSPAPVSEIGLRQDALHLYGLQPDTIVSASNRVEDPDLMLYASADSNPVNRVAVRLDLRRYSSPIPLVESVGQSWAVVATISANQTRWLIPAISLGSAMGLIAAAGALLIELARAARRIRSALSMAPARTVAFLAAGIAGLPLLLSIVIGLAVGSLLVLARTHTPGTYAELTWQSYGLLVLLGLCGALVATLAAFFALRREATGKRS